LLEKGQSGEVYNICSGKGYKILDVVKSMSEISGINAKIEQEGNLLRPIDNPIIIGSYDKTEKQVGWRPQVNFEESLIKMFEYWSDQITRNG